MHDQPPTPNPGPRPDESSVSPPMWPGWIAKFMTSHAAQLAPDKAREILERFGREYPDAPKIRQEPEDDFIEYR